MATGPGGGSGPLPPVYIYPTCPNIRVLDSWQPYRREVVRYLNLIHTTHAGRTLCKFMSRGTRFVLIVPHFPPPLDAETKPVSEVDATLRGVAVMRPVALMPNVTVMMPTGEVGTGRGSNALLKYHPATWRQLMKNLGTVLPGAGPGELLYHELIHAMNIMRGKYVFDTVAAQPKMDNLDEFKAILAANMYRSERGFSTLRLDHQTKDPMFETLKDSNNYYNTHEVSIRKWFQTDKEFCVELAQSPARFNPLRVAADDLGIVIPVPMRLPP